MDGGLMSEGENDNAWEAADDKIRWRWRRWKFHVSVYFALKPARLACHVVMLGCNARAGPWDSSPPGSSAVRDASLDISFTDAPSLID